MKKTTKKDEQGFTLIELLIVVAIIAILAAIAIPQFSAYRIKGCNAVAHSDLKNIITAEEAYFVDRGGYFPAALQTGPGGVGETAISTAPLLSGSKLSKNVTAKIIATAGASGTVYTAGTANSGGNKVYVFESEEALFAYSNKVANVDWDGSDFTAATTTSDFAGHGLTDHGLFL